MVTTKHMLYILQKQKQSLKDLSPVPIIRNTLIKQAWKVSRPNIYNPKVALIVGVAFVKVSSSHHHGLTLDCRVQNVKCHRMK